MASVLAQDDRNFELIVVDDGSTDGTDAVLASFSRERFRLLRQDRTGVSAARNRGIEAARGEWIALLDSDDEWLPAKLSRQRQFFREHPELNIGQTGEIWIRNGRRVNPMKKHQKRGGWIFEHCLPLCVVSPSAVMIRRELFEEVGLFDETLPACEDYDLWLRIAAHYPIGLLDEPLMIKYGGHPDQLSFTEKYLDRYRIRALEKILESGTLSPENKRLAAKEMVNKCRIYGEGCLKRGKIEEGEQIIALAQRYYENTA